MIEHVISRNCRTVLRTRDYEQARAAWATCKAGCKPSDVARWDHESTERDDFAPDPHCGLVTVPAIFSGAMIVHPECYILTVARFEHTPSGRKRGKGSPKLGAV